MAQEIPREQAEAIIQELYDTTGNRAIYLKLDLSNLKAVKEAAEEFLRCPLYRRLLLTRVDILMQQGGQAARPLQQRRHNGTSDGRSDSGRI
jgi:hypothetical protein